MVGQRVSRLVQIISLLQSDTGWKAPDLAERFGVSRTRIFDDLRALRDAGVPVTRTGSGYGIKPSFFLSSLRLTPDEVLGLLFTAERVADGRPEPAVLRSARAKLLGCLPAEKRVEVTERLGRTSVQFPVSSAANGVLDHLRSALADRRRVAITHRKAGDGEVERLRADPCGLGYLRDAWFLAAYSVEHRELETFRVSDILSVESTGIRFTVPEGFTAASHFGRPERVFNGRAREIAVRFTCRVSQTVRDAVPLPFHLIQSLGDGGILFRATVDDLGWAADWVMRFGNDAKVLYPQELAEQIVARARDIIASYEAPTSMATGDVGMASRA